MDWCSSPSLQPECGPESLWLDLGSVTVLGCAFPCPFHCPDGKGFLFHGLIWMLRVDGLAPHRPRWDSCSCSTGWTLRLEAAEHMGLGPWPARGPAGVVCADGTGGLQNRCMLTGPGSLLEALCQGRR